MWDLIFVLIFSKVGVKSHNTFFQVRSYILRMNKFLRMAPPSINLDPYREEIADLLFSGRTISTVLEYLEDTYEVKVGLNTLKRRLQTWNIIVRPSTQDTPALRDRITKLFFDGLDEELLLRVLQEEGFRIGKYSLVRIREELGLKRRLRTKEEEQEAEELATSTLTEELEKGIIQGYGRGLLYAHFQQLGIHVARFVRYYIYYVN